MYEQEFKLFNLQSIHLPMPRQPDKLMSYYVRIPFLFMMYEQEFKLFNLQSIHLPMPRQPDKLMRAIHSDNIAVYVELKDVDALGK